MKKISESIKEKLRIPFGEVYSASEEVVSKYPHSKIIAVGDRSVLSFLRIGVTPYVSVFDFKNLRKRIPKKDIDYLKKSFPNLKILRNLPSTVSRRLMHVAPIFLKTGGALRIYGEEDLAALVFLYFAGEGMLVVYGQKNKGLIAVEPEKNRKRIEEVMEEILPNFFP